MNMLPMIPLESDLKGMWSDLYASFSSSVPALQKIGFVVGLAFIVLGVGALILRAVKGRGGGGGMGMGGGGMGRSDPKKWFIGAIIVGVIAVMPEQAVWIVCALVDIVIDVGGSVINMVKGMW